MTQDCISRLVVAAPRRVNAPRMRYRSAFSPQVARVREGNYLTFSLPWSAPVRIAEKPTTTVSTKGQVILPVEIRRRRRWGAGTRLIVEDTAEGVLLRPAALFPKTRPEEVFGMLAYQGPPKTVDEMHAGIEAEVRRRHARGRY